ncbi:GDSL-type esterase/lipase family protein [Pseudoalteromonas sp. TB41]|uniref:GDSL-type esterase/lipase family protein n=1 Tax=Pseudoalteromonas sp. TB41 TaxID=985149 RepID=UPI001300C38C|nr:GDSL-type esterase/lipase family protein [Pseudoalteromonas sp. TB41]
MSIIFVSFCYGLGVGHYKIFPYNQIKSIKAKLLSESDIEKSIIHSSHYMSHLSLFKGLSNEYDVVFLGDSITYFGLWNEAFIDKKVANRGIGSDTSEGILNRVDQVLAMNPKTVYIMFGINDIANGEKVEDIFKRYKNIVNILIESKIEIVIQSTLLTSKDNWNIKVNQLNKYLFDWSKDNGYVYIDLNEKLAPSGSLTTDASYDGVHLKAEMYLKWFELIQKNI